MALGRSSSQLGGGNHEYLVERRVYGAFAGRCYVFDNREESNMSEDAEKVAVQQGGTHDDSSANEYVVDTGKDVEGLRARRRYAIRQFRKRRMLMVSGLISLYFRFFFSVC